MSPCPDDAILRRLGDDSLDAEIFDEVERHVAACGRCRRALERIARVDPSGSSRHAPFPARAAAPPPTIPGCALGRELGRGGWGVVYEAEQPKLRRRVAVKVLAARADLDARARERWLREARAAAKVKHPNIVRLHDADEHEGRLYLVFDLLSGGSLRDLARGPLPPPLAAGIVETIAGAVEAIHRAGLLHLDVKPANILMDGPPGAELAALEPILSDFGIARDTTEGADLGASGTAGGRGTPSYMAPEQIVALPGTIGPAADVFALGATLYALLTGRPPFQGASTFETMDLLLTTEPAPPRALAPKIPRDLETICLKALQKSPERRYASAQAMADDLARWREGRPIQARPVSKLERAARWSRRHPAPAALAAALVLTTALALVGLTALWLRAEAARARAIRGEASAERLIGDTAGLLREAIEAPERFVSERSEDACRAMLDLTADLRKTPELASRHAATFAAMELELAGFRVARVDFEGADRILDDAVDLLATRFQAEPDSDAGARLAEALLCRAMVSGNRGNLDDGAADIRRAGAILQLHPKDTRARDELVDLHIAQRDLIHRLEERGRDAEARALAREHADDLAAMARRFPDAPDIDFLARFARAGEQAGEQPPAAAWTREAFALFPKGEGMPRQLGQLLADLSARELPRLLADAPPWTDPKDLAAILLAECDARRAAVDASDRFYALLVERLSQVGCVAATEARRAGDFPRTRSHIAWMIALGEMLVDRRDPPGAGHVMISRAHEQAAKIGWVENDPAVVDRELRAALTEASLAFYEAPDNPTARALIAGFREKYARFAAAEPQRRRPVETPR